MKPKPYLNADSTTALALCIFAAMGAGFNMCRSSPLLAIAFTVHALVLGWIALKEAAMKHKDAK